MDGGAGFFFVESAPDVPGGRLYTVWSCCFELRFRCCLARYLSGGGAQPVPFSSILVAGQHNPKFGFFWWRRPSSCGNRRRGLLREANDRVTAAANPYFLLQQ